MPGCDISYTRKRQFPTSTLPKAVAYLIAIDTSVVGNVNPANDAPNDRTPRRPRWSWPTWLDGRTVALFATVVSATLALGTMMQTAHSSLASDIRQVRVDLGADIRQVRVDLSAEIATLDDRLRAVEVDVAAVRTALLGVDARLRVVEEHIRRPVVPAPAGKRS